jgi:hypothetical protein
MLIPDSDAPSGSRKRKPRFRDLQCKAHLLATLAPAGAEQGGGRQFQVDMGPS